MGSFFSDLYTYYPRYARSGADNFLAHNKNGEEWMTLILYEGVYGLDFISVELVFRGFPVLGFSRTLGGHAVLPMVVTYGFLHFGKPLTETVSSLFGGYVLGIIAHKNRNIWGGVFIHLGVAWAMELFGWLQRMRLGI